MDNRDTLRELEEQIYRKGRLETKLRHLQKEDRELRYAMEVYARQAAEEQGDVDALTARTLKGFLARLQKNTYQDRLTREQAEAAAAAAKFENAQNRLAELETQIGEMTGEIRKLRMAEREYERCLEERRQRIRTQPGQKAEKLTVLEQKGDEIRAKKREVDEAVTAGKRVQSLAGQIDRELSEAEGWGKWDVMDKAGRMIDSLQKLIGDFRTELTDVSLLGDVQVEMDGFTRFTDIFWDGVFVDLSVLDRIREARERIGILGREVDRLMQELSGMAAETDRALAGNEAEIRRLVTEE